MKFAKPLLAMLLAGAVLLAACGQEPAPPDALTVALSEPFDSNFNYFDTESDAALAVIDLVAGTILHDDGSPYLGQMSAREEEGQLIVTVSLQKGLRFSSGDDASIDDLLFLYYLLADPGYTGPRTALREAPIAGMSEYYWDSPRGSGEAPDFDALARESYAPDVISREDLKTYLRETRLAGEYSGNPTDYRSDGITWAQFIADEGRGEDLSAAMSNGGAVLDILVDIYAEKYGQNYDATGWYARKLRREYMRTLLEDGVNVPQISGITRLSDTSCELTFTDPTVDYRSLLNLPLLSSANYRFTNKGGGDAAASSYSRSPIVGAGPYTLEKWEDGIVSLRANRTFSGDDPAFERVRLRAVNAPLIPENIALGQIILGVVRADGETARQILAEAEKAGLASLPLRDGALLYDKAIITVDTSPRTFRDAVAGVGRVKGR